MSFSLQYLNVPLGVEFELHMMADANIIAIEKQVDPSGALLTTYSFVVPEDQDGGNAIVVRKFVSLRGGVYLPQYMPEQLVYVGSVADDSNVPFYFFAIRQMRSAG